MDSLLVLADIGPPLLVALLMAIMFGVPLTCPPLVIDEYQRYTGDTPTGLHQLLCVATGDQEQYRKLVAQVLVTILGIILTGFCAQAAASLFHSMATRDDEGMTVGYAELLLNLQAPSTRRSILERFIATYKYQRGRKRFVRKLMLVGAVMLVPLYGNVVGLITPVVYSERQVRFTNTSVKVASIPEWITVENLTKYGWHKRMAVNYGNKRFSRNEDPRKDVYRWFDANHSSSTPQVTPTGIESSTLWQWLSFNDDNPEPGYGSGLQTVAIQFPRASRNLRTLGAVPLTNILLTPGTGLEGHTAPFAFSDFTINQSLLLIGQTCSVGHTGERLPVDDGKFWSTRLDLETTPNASVNTQPKYVPPFTPSELAAFRQLTSGDPAYVWGLSRGDPSAAVNASENLPFYPDGRSFTSFQNKPAVNLTIHYDWEWGNFTDADNSTNTSTSAEALFIYTAAPTVWVGDQEDIRTQGLMCKTTVVPIVFNATIPSGFSFVREVPHDYQYTPFTAASRQLVEQALNHSKAAVETLSFVIDALMSRRSTRLVSYMNVSEPFFNRVIPTCIKSNVVRDIWKLNKSPFLPKTMIIQRFWDDACVGTEFDRLFRAYLSFLSWIPDDKPQRMWAWGKLEVRFVPNKVYCSAMIAVLMLLAASVVALQYVSALAVPERGSVDLTAPWAGALAKLGGQLKGSCSVAGARLPVDEQAACVVKYDTAAAEFVVARDEVRRGMQDDAGLALNA